MFCNQETFLDKRPFNCLDNILFAIKCTNFTFVIFKGLNFKKIIKMFRTLFNLCNPTCNFTLYNLCKTENDLQILKEQKRV